MLYAIKSKASTRSAMQWILFDFFTCFTWSKMPVPENAFSDKDVNNTCPPSSTYFHCGIRVSLNNITSHSMFFSSPNSWTIFSPFSRFELRMFLVYTIRSLQGSVASGKTYCSIVIATCWITFFENHCNT